MTINNPLAQRFLKHLEKEDYSHFTDLQQWAKPFMPVVGDATVESDLGFVVAIGLSPELADVLIDLLIKGNIVAVPMSAKEKLVFPSPRGFHVVDERPLLPCARRTFFRSVFRATNKILEELGAILHDLAPQSEPYNHISSLAGMSAAQDTEI